MMHNKAFKYRLYPNREQKEPINRTMGCSRLVYYHFLEKWDREYKQTGRGLSYNECATALPSLKKEYECLGEVDSNSPPVIRKKSGRCL
jgi:putative transposase